MCHEPNLLWVFLWPWPLTPPWLPRCGKANPHPFGMFGHTMKPTMLSGAGFTSGLGVTNVELSYGRPLAVTGPLTVVETCFAASESSLFPLEEVITRAVLRDDAWSREDWEAEPGLFEPGPERVVVPSDSFEHATRIAVVATQDRSLALVSRGKYEALRFDHSGLVVTAVARAGFGDRPVFDVVSDLAPYLAEHRQFILSWLRFW
jgi:hypothetical protein